MSVIEFFVNYWDWYLLIGVVFAACTLLKASYHNIKESWAVKGCVCVFIVVGWPLFTIAWALS